MNFGNRFSSENFLISVCGHLALIVILVTSFAAVVDRAMTVASDRIEILEIDLDSVRVSGDETILYNVNADSEPETSDDTDVSNQSDNDAASVSDTEPAPIETEPEQITVPSLVEETPTAPDVPDPVVKTVEDEPKPTPSETEKPKKKKTVIRVNRESV